jgi:predicted transcriptional regulator
MQTKVKDLMKENPIIIPASTTLKEAAQKMKSVDCGVLPVGTWDNLEGMITDRDIVIRAVAEGVDITSAQVRDYMTSDVFYCSESDTLAQAAEQMRKNDVSRLVVKDASGKACGILTFGRILREDENLKEIGKVVECAVGKKAA